MGELALTLLGIAVGLVALLWIGTSLAQGYFYDSPTGGMVWRAPAGAAILAAFFALWAFIDYRTPRVTDTIFNFSTLQIDDVDKFTSVRRTELGQEQEIPYARRSRTSGEFVDEKGERWARSRSGTMIAIIVDEKKGDDIVRTRFNAEMKDGKFAPRQIRGVEQTLRYVEEGGNRYMAETQLGKIVSYRKSRWFSNIALNALHFGIWFVVLWLVMRFTWPHALGFAALCWLAFTLTLVPYVLGKSRAAGDKRARATAAMILPTPLAASQHGDQYTFA